MTELKSRSIVETMEPENSANALANQIRDLERKIDLLAANCQRLRDENKSLREQQSNLISERAKLIEKNESAKSRVEDIVNRLRAMERSS